MKNFALIFRITEEPGFKPAAALMEERMASWMEWMDTIGDNLVSGNHFSKEEAKTVQSDKNVSKGPYQPANEFVAGYIIVRTKTIDEAVAIAKKCPILGGEGNRVEVRAIAAPGGAD